MEIITFALVLAAVAVGAIIWRVTRKKSAGRIGIGGGGRPGADKH